MRRGFHFEGLGVSLVLIASFLVALNTVPSAEASHAVVRPLDATTPRVYATSDNAETSTATNLLKEVRNATLLAWTPAANLTGGQVHWVESGYNTDEATDLLGTTATLFYTTDGSAPVKNGQKTKIEVLRKVPPQTPELPVPDPLYRGDIPVANLTGGKWVLFVIELKNGNDPQGGAEACDLGWDPRVQRRNIVTGGCPTNADQLVGKGFNYTIGDPVRPRLQRTLITPHWDPNLSKAVFASAAAWTTIAFDVKDAPFNSVTQCCRLDLQGTMGGAPRSLLVTLTWGSNTVVLYNHTTPSQGACGGTNCLTLTQTNTTANQTLSFAWRSTATAPTVNWPPTVNTDVTLNVAVHDFAGNFITFTTADPSPVLHRDTIKPNNSPPASDLTVTQVTPSQLNTTGNPPTNIVVTGIGAVATVRACVLDTHMNTTNPSAVKMFFSSKVGTTTVFETENTTLPFVATGAGLCTGTGVKTFRGPVALLPKAGSGSSLPSAFFLNATAWMVDAVGNANATVKVNVKAPDPTDAAKTWKLQIRKGAPVVAVTPATNTNGFAKTGPYNVTALVTDADPGVDDNLVKLRITNSTGTWSAALPTAWTAVPGWPNTWELKMTKGTGANYSLGIPDATIGSIITYSVRAQDKIGNLAGVETGGTSNITLKVDKKGPLLNETGVREWRTAPPNDIRFLAVDEGVGLNASTVQLFYRIQGATTTYSTKNMTVSGGVANATISPAGGHLKKIDYYVKAKDLLGNDGNNGTDLAPRNYTIDTEPPEVTLDPIPTESTDGLVTLTALATDEDSGIDRIVFQGHYKAQGQAAFSEYVDLQNGTSAAAGPLCLGGGGLTYEFRAFAIDAAGNLGAYSAPRAVTVTGAGCNQTIEVAIPAPTTQVDAAAGQGTTLIQYLARPTGSFTAAALLTIKVEYLLDNEPFRNETDQKWLVLSSSGPNSGQFLWRLQVPSCEACRVRVTATLPDGTNGTGVSDAFAILNGIPTTDLDHNDIPDECELTYFGGLGIADADDDPDGDGLETGRECGLAQTYNGTHPLDPLKLDSDGDRVADGLEIRLGSDPTDPNSKPSDTELRLEDWGSYYFVVPAVFAATAAVFLLGIARRW